MKSITIFRALLQAQSTKNYCVRSREKGMFGIAVDNDPIALAWRRLDRQCTKFIKHIENVLVSNTPR